MPLIIRKLAAAELEWANSRYSEVDFLPSTQSDIVAVAEIDGVAAGLGRLTHVGRDITELGGMYVFAEHRGLGVSKSLIEFLISTAGVGTLYCLPFEHLRGLYASAGFETCLPGESVPEKVLRKHAWCNAHYPYAVLLMRHTSGP
jgi:GNAT superfamily N-acetyltransferase